MVGKCFKGLTDELLTWQTKQLLARETGRRGIAVLVRPELVVEIAVDGVQSSTRYAGGGRAPLCPREALPAGGRTPARPT
jgi:DNA ligase 1